MRQITIAIVGIDHPNRDRSKSNRRFELLQCAPGDPLSLVPDPKNKHDEHAIAVFSERGIQLGFLPSERAVLIGSHMRWGVDVRAIFQAMGDRVAWCRVAFDEDPVLPPAAAAAPADDGFYPDDPAGEWGA